MRNENRDGEIWVVAENEQDRKELTRRARVLASHKQNHSFIYVGELGEENPVIYELSY